MDAWLLLRGAARGLSIASSFSIFGTILMAATILRSQPLPGLRKIAWLSLAFTLTAATAWFLLQTADFANAQSLNNLVSAIPIVAEDTRFGSVLIARMAALSLATIILQAGYPRPATIIATPAVIAESWLGHGGAMTGTTGTILLITSIIHITAGASWLGSLPALRHAIKTLPIATATITAKNVSPIGIACVASLAATATAQSYLLIGRASALFTTPYGAAALIKIFLLIILIILAALNRSRFVPNLPTTRPHLLRGISLEIAIGLLILIAAGILIQLEPPTMASMAMGQ